MDITKVTHYAFLSAPSVWRATDRWELKLAGKEISIHALRVEGDKPRAADGRAFVCAISIHALRVEGDGKRAGGRSHHFYFYPRPPCGGRQFNWRHFMLLFGYFYPRPPCGGRPARLYQAARYMPISIHALRVEGDANFPGSLGQFVPISIHALRVEGDGAPCGRRALCRGISIHALRVEGDQGLWIEWTKIDDFYPRPPCGGRQGSEHYGKNHRHFYPRPPCGGRLQLSLPYRRVSTDFYPRPPCGGRRKCLAIQKSS